MTRPIAALRSPTLMNILANVALWLQTDMQPPEIEVRLYPNKRHSLADVRYRVDFVRSTPSNRRSRWGREMTGFDPGCVKTVLWRPKRNFNSLSRPQPQ